MRVRTKCVIIFLLLAEMPKNRAAMFPDVVWHAECILLWNWEELTCKRLRHTWEANRVPTSPSTKKKLGRCSVFSRGPSRRFTEGRIDAWAMQPTLRMRFRMHSCPLAVIWANSRARRKMSTWLTTIVTNSALTQLRRRSRQAHVSLDERFGKEQEYCVLERLADCGPGPENECIKSELHERLMRFVAELSPSLRKGLQLRDLDGLITREAAHILGVADVTVNAQVSRARAKLRQLVRVALDAQARSALTCTALPVVARSKQPRNPSRAVGSYGP